MRYAVEAYESQTVSGTASGIGTLTFETAKAFGTVETADIRFTVDGTTTPTSSVGHEVLVGQTITLEIRDEVANFSAIRTGGVSAAIKWTKYRRID